MLQQSYLNDPYTWNPSGSSAECVGAKTITLWRFDDGREAIIAETPDGREFKQYIGDDGPLIALERLSFQIRTGKEFGKKYREFRQKRRSILIRRFHGRFR